MRLRSLRLLVGLTASLLPGLAGCTSLSEYVHNGFKVGPNYQMPAAPLASNWIDANDKRAASPDLREWWKVFNDPILDDLVCTAYRQNLTLRQAGTRILQARAQLGIAVGNVFPQEQFLSGSYTTNAVSGATGNAANFSGGQRNRTFGQWNFGFALAWELDFWGRFRRAVEAAEATLDASAAEYDDVLVTLIGDVASNYVQFRTLQQRIEFARKNVDIQNETQEKAQARLKVDKNGALTLDQAIALLKQTEAEIPKLETDLRKTTNRLCVLLGIPPEDLQAKLGKGPIPVAPPDASLGIPADLLRRRPDVRRAERIAAAQSAEIGIAQAEFYPAITLSGNLGVSARHFKDLFSSNAFNGSFGPSFQWNVLNYGRIRNNVRLQDARFQEFVVAYQGTVLAAQEDVENGIVTFLKAHERERLQRQSVESAQKAEDISKKRWLTNDVTFTTVSLIQQNKVQQDDTLAQAQGDIALGLIQIYRALGGGWEIRCTGCEVATPPAPPEPLPGPGPAARFGTPN